MCAASCSSEAPHTSDFEVNTACNDTTFQRWHGPDRKTTAEGAVKAAFTSGNINKSSLAAATAALFSSPELPPRAFPDFLGEARAGGVLEYQVILDHVILPAHAETLKADNDVLDPTITPRLDAGTERGIAYDQDGLLEHAILLHQTGQLQVAEKAYTALLQVRTKCLQFTAIRIQTLRPCILSTIHEIPCTT